MNQIINKAKALVAKPVESANDPTIVEAADPITVNELLAFRSEISVTIDELTAQKKEIDGIIRDLIGEASTLTVHGAEVASISRWRETRVLTDVVKEMFQPVDYPELYKREDKSRLNIKR